MQTIMCTKKQTFQGTPIKQMFIHRQSPNSPAPKIDKRSQIFIELLKIQGHLGVQAILSLMRGVATEKIG